MNANLSVSPTSLALDFVSQGQSLAHGFRTFVSEVSETEFHSCTKEQIATAIDDFLSDASSVWLKPTRLNTDGDSWVDFGKKIASACVGNDHVKGIKVLCRLRAAAKNATAPSATALASGSVSTLAKRSTTEKGADLFRWVSWEVSLPAAKRAADAFDAMPFEGSDRADSPNAYPLAAGPALLGPEPAAIVQNKALASIAMSHGVELKAAKQAAKAATKRHSIRMQRVMRIAHEFRDANAALMLELATARAELSAANEMIATLQEVKPTVKRTVRKPTAKV